MYECALIFGRAHNVWNEVAEAKKLFDFDLTIAVGSAGVDYPGHIDVWVSFHLDLLPYWSAQRVKAGRSKVMNFWTANYRGSPLYNRLTVPCQRVDCEGGSSGLIAAMVSLQLAKCAVLAGIPMEPTPTYDKIEPWDEALRHRAAWQQYLPQLKGRVTSMSGWTQQQLGAPDHG